MSPSPALLTSWPPHVVIAARNADMKRAVKASNESSPSRARRCVEATRSQKRIVTVSVVAIGCIIAWGPANPVELSGHSREVPSCPQAASRMPPTPSDPSTRRRDLDHGSGGRV